MSELAGTLGEGSEMSELTPLEKYTAACGALAAFEELHSDVLSRYVELKASTAMAEDGLRVWARENGPTENDVYKVTVTRKVRKWYDADKIIELAPYVREIPGVVVQSIDKAKVEKLATAGAIDKAICEQAYHEEPMTPAVSIKVRS